MSILHTTHSTNIDIHSHSLQFYISQVVQRASNNTGDTGSFSKVVLSQEADWIFRVANFEINPL